MRGREVPSRTLTSRFEGHLSLSASVLCEHPAALRSVRCWVVPGRDSSSSAGSVRRVPSLHSAVSLRLVYTRPLFLRTSSGASPVRSAPGSRDTALPRCWRSVCIKVGDMRRTSRKHTLRRRDSARLRHQRPTAIRGVGRPGPGW